MNDMTTRGRHVSTKKNFCPANHPYDELNTYIEPSTGRRRCRTCMKIQKHLRYLDPTKKR
jgi:hypothetical protein